uniref:Apple domain-containing protein n=1 Tax=Panagrellus redivivus TaxID=6233 RepID=A0A7E4ZTQ6_PANRE
MLKFALISAIFKIVATLSAPPLNTFVALNECFQHRQGFKLDITEAHMTGTDSIQFKDDCLRACLRSLLQDTFTCRSLMHMPRDDDCVLTSMSESTGAKVEKVDDHGFMSTVNYYENKCADSPYKKPAAIAQVEMKSFRGARAIVEIAQAPGEKLQIMALIDGVRPNGLVDVNVRRGSVKSCDSLRHNDVKLSERVLQMFTDASGMAVQPWSDVDLGVLGKDYLGSTVLLVDTMTQHVIDCGVIKIKGDPVEYERVKSTASVSGFSMFAILSVLATALRVL